MSKWDIKEVAIESLHTHYNTKKKYDIYDLFKAIRSRNKKKREDAEKVVIHLFGEYQRLIKESD